MVLFHISANNKVIIIYIYTRCTRYLLKQKNKRVFPKSFLQKLYAFFSNNYYYVSIAYGCGIKPM